MSSAFVVGYTGETGKALVKELIARKRFQKLVLFGRRKPETEFPSFVECKVIDFDKLDDLKQEFAGFEQGFNCLGSTRTHHGTEMFLKVDKEYTIKVAQIAKEGGCKHYHLVSSMGASKSRNLYTNTKWEAEEATIACNFDRVSIYQPGMIMVDRVESRPMEHFFRVSFFYQVLLSHRLKLDVISGYLQTNRVGLPHCFYYAG